MGFPPANLQLATHFHSRFRVRHGTDGQTDNGHRCIMPPSPRPCIITNIQTQNNMSDVFLWIAKYRCFLTMSICMRTKRRRRIGNVGYAAGTATSRRLGGVRRRLGDETRDPAWRHAAQNRSHRQLRRTVADEQLRPSRHCPVCTVAMFFSIARSFWTSSVTVVV